MDGKVFQAEMLINGLYFVNVLIDHGSTAYALISEAFAKTHDLAFGGFSWFSPYYCI
jgi:hypothetical protein